MSCLGLGLSASSSVACEALDLDPDGFLSPFDVGRAVRPTSPLDPQYVHSAPVMSQLAWAIYLSDLKKGEIGAEPYHTLGHTIVAHGKTADVAWLVTDSVATVDGTGRAGRVREHAASSSGERERAGMQCRTRHSSLHARTITMKGFDSVDQEVNKDRLISNICTASPLPMIGGTVEVHSGLLSIARELYREVRMYIDFLPSANKVILNGHSIGGSLSVLMMLLLLEEHGVDFVRSRVLNVFTFGSPPISCVKRPIPYPNDPTVKKRRGREEPIPSDAAGDLQEEGCVVLNTLDLPASLVQGYIQPWDPFVRFFTESCAIFPVVGDIGEDGVTPYASGPMRAMRPLLRSIAKAWDSWPDVRDNLCGTGRQRYQSVGMQHILLPGVARYCRDLVQVPADTASVPTVERVVQLPSNELLSALTKAFPLDASNLTEVLVALRGINHHLPQSYSTPFVKYAFKQQQ